MTQIIKDQIPAMQTSQRFSQQLPKRRSEKREGVGWGEGANIIDTTILQTTHIASIYHQHTLQTIRTCWTTTQKSKQTKTHWLEPLRRLHCLSYQLWRSLWVSCHSVRTGHLKNVSIGLRSVNQVSPTRGPPNDLTAVGNCWEWEKKIAYIAIYL